MVEFMYKMAAIYLGLLSGYATAADCDSNSISSRLLDGSEYINSGYSLHKNPFLSENYPENYCQDLSWFRLVKGSGGGGGHGGGHGRGHAGGKGPAKSLTIDSNKQIDPKHEGGSARHCTSFKLSSWIKCPTSSL